MCVWQKTSYKTAAHRPRKDIHYWERVGPKRVPPPSVRRSPRFLALRNLPEQTPALSQHDVVAERLRHAGHDGIGNVVNRMRNHRLPPAPKTLNKVPGVIVGMRSSERGRDFQGPGLNLSNIDIHEG